MVGRCQGRYHGPVSGSILSVGVRVAIIVRYHGSVSLVGIIGRYRWSVSSVGIVGRCRWSALLVGIMGEYRWLVSLVGIMGWYRWSVSLVPWVAVRVGIRSLAVRYNVRWRR